MSLKFIWYVGFLVTNLAAPLFAATVVDGTAGASSAPSILGVVNNLMLVVLIILVLAWLFRRFAQPGQASGGNFRLSQVTNLGNRQKIVLLKADGKQFLIGISPNHMCLLAETQIPESEGPELEGPKVPFASLLSKLRAGGTRETKA